MVDAGLSIDEIEAKLLETVTVTEEQRSALWLYAWGQAQRTRRVHPRTPERQLD